MHILNREFYQERLDYDPVEGTLVLKGTDTSAVEYRRNNHAIVRVELEDDVIEEQPAAIIAWLLSGKRWTYDTMIVNQNRDLGDITLANLVAMPKAAYEASKRNRNLPPAITDAIALCNLGLKGTVDLTVALEGVRRTLETLVKA